MDQRYRQERNEIQTILGNVTLDAEEKEEFIDQEFSAEKDDITSKHTEVYHYLKVQLESKIEEKKDQLIAVCHDCSHAPWRVSLCTLLDLPLYPFPFGCC